MDKFTEIINTLKEFSFGGDILEHEPLASKSTFKIGSTARLFIAPADLRSFQLAFAIIYNSNLPFFITGGCSNIVFPDNEYNGVILSTSKFNKIQLLNDEAKKGYIEMAGDKNKELADALKNDDIKLVEVYGGTPMASFVKFCTDNCLSGAEQFAGLPGSVGGALFMNARCFDKSICELLVHTSHIGFDGEDYCQFSGFYDKDEWDYKKSPFQPDTKRKDILPSNNKIVTSAIFALKTGLEKTQIEQECKKFVNERVSKGHFEFPSAGSVFKNNHDFGKPSGKIIDEAGLRGYEIGGAQIAPFHGNFIINKSNATQKDVKQLVEYIQKNISEKFGFLLEPEIIFVDNDNNNN